MDASQIVRRFPLVARPRPACSPLVDRVQEIGGLAREAECTGRLAPASAAFNKAALLASDCALPDLATALCWRHAVAYLRTQPLGAQVARFGLEPLVNLARLLIRSGDGGGGFALLDSMYRAVTSGTAVTIDGNEVSFEHITGANEDRRKLHQWLWTVLLADGTRALASADMWAEAHAQVQRHKGIGSRMLDGRQVAVIAHITAGDIERAEVLLSGTVPGEAWESTIAVLLTVLCRRTANLPVHTALDGLVDLYRSLERSAGLAVFLTRLGLSAIDLAGGQGSGIASRIATDLVEETIAVGDGYAARDVLSHPGCHEYMTAQQAGRLQRIVEGCALGSGAIPEDLRVDLFTALNTSESVITRVCAAAPSASA
ncbi:hypothetical protein SAMN05428942_2156 [Streptomyces sp. 2112.2]|uniref:hypothetical protein n=1 Tax=Streptomyces sp. 2112.2 TaxID=1881024 RepID=UPI000899D595|nr:hypothetical protein [Streptomyces sp. 2112.2]SED62817.1 hypothetical protein SAMN05428942_2156 [Streptomyces sp. 2112.2]